MAQNPQNPNQSQTGNRTQERPSTSTGNRQSEQRPGQQQPGGPQRNQPSKEIDPSEQESQ